MRKPSRPRLRGRKIVRVDWGDFKTGCSDHPTTTSPTFLLDDGSRLHFTVIETEVGEYGIEATLWKAGSQSEAVEE